MKVTFIGNHDAPETIYPTLYEAVEGLILRGANDFYVGHNGCFDTLVRRVLKDLKRKYPDIRFAVS